LFYVKNCRDLDVVAGSPIKYVATESLCICHVCIAVKQCLIVGYAHKVFNEMLGWTIWLVPSAPLFQWFHFCRICYALMWHIVSKLITC
jgi:hypothetical protein